MSVLSVLFDLDGVISDTVSVHAKAWKTVFDDVLESRGLGGQPFLIGLDYPLYLDGKMRLAGIESFLGSRDIALPLGSADDMTRESITGIGNLKNRVFRQLIADEGMALFDDATRLMTRLKAAGCPLGLASSSKNARAILDKVGLTPWFAAIMDGVVAETQNVASKPHPDFYVHAANLLGRLPSECAVIEDATSGVISAKQAGIKLVVAISRHGNDQALWDSGADMVVDTLDDVPVEKLY